MAFHEGRPRLRGGLLPSTRLEAFSDGVFAIAITLLVLELDVPAMVDGLLGELGREWPSYVGYFVSVAFIGGVWMAHTTLTRFLKAADQVLLGLNPAGQTTLTRTPRAAASPRSDRLNLTTAWAAVA